MNELILVYRQFHPYCDFFADDLNVIYVYWKKKKTGYVIWIRNIVFVFERFLLEAYRKNRNELILF